MKSLLAAMALSAICASPAFADTSVIVDHNINDTPITLIDPTNEAVNAILCDLGTQAIHYSTLVKADHSNASGTVGGGACIVLRGILSLSANVTPTGQDNASQYRLSISLPPEIGAHP